MAGILIGLLLVALSPGVGAAAAALCRAYDDEAHGGEVRRGLRRDAAAAAAVAAAVALAAVLVAGDEMVPAAILGWTLLALALIDLRHGILPDLLTLPLLLLGLAFAAAARRGLPVDEALGAAAGYAVFAGVAALYRGLRGREGLGLGDAKLLAAGGAWLGWSALPLVVAAASLSALALTALGAAYGRPPAADREIRFGPFLCLAVWAVFLYRAAAFL